MKPLVIEADDFGTAWENLLGQLMATGDMVSPRGKPTREHRDVTLYVYDGHANILVSIERNPSYRFMVAEWLWIWFGRDDVETIKRYNSNIAVYSDDGERFRGAYGPRIQSQWARVYNMLAIDGDTREAVIQIYDKTDLNGTSKDVPCTISIQFFIRNGRLETSVTMRSSDIWLGLPYDFFNFSMLGNIMAALQNIPQGPVTMKLGSSHIYERDVPQATRVLSYLDHVTTMRSPQLPGQPQMWLERQLTRQDTLPPKEHQMSPWVEYALALVAPSNAAALTALREIHATIK